MILFLFYSLIPCLSGVSLQWKKSLILENFLSNNNLINGCSSKLLLQLYSTPRPKATLFEVQVRPNCSERRHPCETTRPAWAPRVLYSPFLPFSPLLCVLCSVNTAFVYSFIPFLGSIQWFIGSPTWAQPQRHSEIIPNISRRRFSLPMQDVKLKCCCGGVWQLWITLRTVHLKAPALWELWYCHTWCQVWEAVWEERVDVSKNN